MQEPIAIGVGVFLASEPTNEGDEPAFGYGTDLEATQIDKQTTQFDEARQVYSVNMVATLANQDDGSGAEWGCFGTDITGADSTAIGSGALNTADLLAAAAMSAMTAALGRSESRELLRS